MAEAGAEGPPYAADWPSGEAATAVARVKLLDGQEMPVFGLGVYQTPPGKQTENAVLWALEAGYRLVDTAALYRNEKSVGAAIKKSGVPREELFVTTKLWDADHGYDQALAACQQSLRNLGMEYLDLYLIHSPNNGKLVETWDALLELKRRGLARSVGVSNMDMKHIETLVEHDRPLPAVNQFEMHPMIWRERAALLEYCKQQGIIVTAYGSMFAGDTQFLEDAKLKGVAEASGKSVGQVLLRWGHQMGFAIIPKSEKQHRIQENIDIFDFELSPEQMEVLSGMRGRLGRYWNPLKTRVDVGDTSRSGA